MPAELSGHRAEMESTTAPAPSTWVVIGASRGIGIEFVRQLLAQGHQVIAAVRNIQTANQIWQVAGQQTRPAACLIEQCDVTDEASINVRRDTTA